ncbi:hypothetical protein [Acidiluteibacter ferrifornacis]|uniref:DUF4149 domain-containing protein n=1 Tax=Acidiluteibacter ferrifornacis TaxID=2692424 RepID=A0A6N9NIK1_9FLAO|nr:hypothetical protein [Acidiluteibacter ferrifornacis]NBG65669.1 hypothetical protein [Acidiluteibacter ferrifornacis]
MSVKTKYPVAIVVTFLWIGFVSAISFMEAWLKFQANGITLSLGLGIGQLVFGALNKVEWIFAIAILVQYLNSRKLLSFSLGFYYISFSILILQTFWLLPDLDARAELIIQGQIVPSSYLYFYYIALEVIKVICLTIFGIRLFKK